MQKFFVWLTKKWKQEGVKKEKRKRVRTRSEERKSWKKKQNKTKDRNRRKETGSESSNMCTNTLERLDPQYTNYQYKLYIKQLMCGTWTKA